MRMRMRILEGVELPVDAPKDVPGRFKVAVASARRVDIGSDLRFPTIWIAARDPCPSHTTLMGSRLGLLDPVWVYCPRTRPTGGGSHREPASSPSRVPHPTVTGSDASFGREARRLGLVVDHDSIAFEGAKAPLMLVCSSPVVSSLFQDSILLSLPGFLRSRVILRCIMWGGARVRRDGEGRLSPFVDHLLSPGAATSSTSRTQMATQTPEPNWTQETGACRWGSRWVAEGGGPDSEAILQGFRRSPQELVRAARVLIVSRGRGNHGTPTWGIRRWRDFANHRRRSHML